MGLFGARDWDKYVFSVPFPTFDPADRLHADLARAGATAEGLAATTIIPAGLDFKAARRAVRLVLAADGVDATIEALSDQLLPAVSQLLEPMPATELAEDKQET